MRRKSLFSLIMIAIVATATLPPAIYAFSVWRDAVRAAEEARAAPPRPQMYDADPVQSWVTKPNLDIVMDDGSRILTDSHGWRVGVEGGPERAEIVFVGGSLTWGEGIDFEKTFPYLTGQLIGKSIRLVAVSGYGTVQALQSLDDAIDPETQYVVYGYWVDHLRRNVRPCALVDGPLCVAPPVVERGADGSFQIVTPDDATPAAEWERWRAETTSADTSAFDVIKWRWRAIWSDLDLTSQEVALGLPEEVDRQYEVLRYLLNEMNDRAETVGARLIVLEISAFNNHFDIPPPDARIAEICDDVGCRFLSLSDVFEDLRTRKISMHIPNNGHLNETAQRTTAAMLSGALARIETSAR